MNFAQSRTKLLHGTRVALAFAGIAQTMFGPLVQSAKAADKQTQTPIKHVIVIVGENRTFDHLFATYKPQPGESVNNLLSQGIVNEDGTPGPNFARSMSNRRKPSKNDHPGC